MMNEEHRKIVKGDTLPTVNMIMKELQLSFQQQAAAIQQSVGDRCNTETADMI